MCAADGDVLIGPDKRQRASVSFCVRVRTDIRVVCMKCLIRYACTGRAPLVVELYVRVYALCVVVRTLACMCIRPCIRRFGQGRIPDNVYP